MARIPDKLLSINNIADLNDAYYIIERVLNSSTINDHRLTTALYLLGKALNDQYVLRKIDKIMERHEQLY